MNKELFSEFTDFTKKGFSLLYPALAELIPMKPSQRKELPHACRELSEYLTTEREMLSRPYWTNPRLLSAYFHYFLMWNLIRLCKLFPQINLGTIPPKCTFADLGSGPLTIPLALFLSRKDLHKKEITFICADIAPQPLQIGRNLFEILRQKLAPECLWKIEIVRAPNHKILRQIHTPVSLITMGNVLNEGDEKKKISTFEQIRHIYDMACQVLDDTGKIFVVEPGTRQGARMIQILRTLVTEEIQELDKFEDADEEIGEVETSENGWAENAFEDEQEEAPHQIISPCPHAVSCPLTRQFHKQNAWCHFNTETAFIPKELKELSQKAGLDKESVSLSYLYLAKKELAEKLLKQEQSKHKARIISDAFVVPHYKGRARYACHEKGLLLILDSTHLPMGTLCDVRFPAKITRDFKSKAILCMPADSKYKNLKEIEQIQIITDKKTDTAKQKSLKTQKTPAKNIKKETRTNKNIKQNTDKTIAKNKTTKRNTSLSKEKTKAKRIFNK